MSKQQNVRIQWEGGEEAEVLRSAAPTWIKHGWTVVDDGSSETPARKPRKSERNQDEVQHQLSLLDDQNKE